MKNWRLWIITAIIFGSYSALVFNIYTLQVKKSGYYSARAASQNQLSSTNVEKRGGIYFTDKNGNKIPAAINREYPVIYAVPKEISDVDEATELLALVLKTDSAKLKNLLKNPKDLYKLLLAKASSEQVAKIKSLGIKGVYVDSAYFRFYPFGPLAAHVLGFVGPNETNGAQEGRYGLESYYENLLQKKDLVLTVDINIQSQAEKILKGLIDQYAAVSGTVIVQDPKTGKILAMGSYPNFDPNDYSKSSLKNFINPAIQTVYEPGSVFKVLTMSAGIDSGKITPDTTFYDSGSLVLNGKTIKNWDKKAHGTVTMTEVIEQSINIGAAFAEKKTGHDIFYNYLLKFGLDKPTGIGMPGEIVGKLANLKAAFREINFANASFGQGVSVTPIELIGAISAIANGGTLMKPYLTSSTQPQSVRSVLSPNTAQKVAGMMVSAVRKAGIAQIPGYEIAGKTGTAQVPDFKKGGYEDEYIHSYAGFAPASAPKFTILMKIDKPKGAPLAGMTVVPAFRELAQFILNYYNIPADNLATSH